jgi:hypothetical protein
MNIRPEGICRSRVSALRHAMSSIDFTWGIKGMPPEAGGSSPVTRKLLGDVACLTGFPVRLP